MITFFFISYRQEVFTIVCVRDFCEFENVASKEKNEREDERCKKQPAKKREEASERRAQNNELLSKEASTITKRRQRLCLRREPRDKGLCLKKMLL